MTEQLNSNWNNTNQCGVSAFLWSPLALWVWGLVLNLTQGTPKVVNQQIHQKIKVVCLDNIYLFIFLWGLTSLTHPQGQGLSLRSPVWYYITLVPQPGSLNSDEYLIQFGQSLFTRNLKLSIIDSCLCLALAIKPWNHFRFQ